MTQTNRTAGGSDCPRSSCSPAGTDALCCGRDSYINVLFQVFGAWRQHYVPLLCSAWCPLMLCIPDVNRSRWEFVALLDVTVRPQTCWLVSGQPAVAVCCASLFLLSEPELLLLHVPDFVNFRFRIVLNDWVLVCLILMSSKCCRQKDSLIFVDIISTEVKCLNSVFTQDVKNHVSGLCSLKVTKFDVCSRKWSHSTRTATKHLKPNSQRSSEKNWIDQTSAAAEAQRLKWPF